MHIGKELIYMLIRIIQRMLSMCPLAWYIFRRGIQLCVILLFAALVVLVERNGGGADAHQLSMLSAALNETAQAVLLVCVLASVIIEDVSA